MSFSLKAQQQPVETPPPYALNVVYFVPTDMEPVPDYRRRLSEILLWLQDYYKCEMTRNGYTNRTFGLSKSLDGTRINIVTIRGKDEGLRYPYRTGGVKVLHEVNDYFAKTNTPQKLSDHTLIIMPSTSGNDLEPGGVPFYGFGKDCFALDYPHFDLKYCGRHTAKGQLFTKWFGGLAHELGHGLGVPHNHEKVSERARLGTALMGAGNYTLGMSPTFLTQASAAILDQSQTFRTTPQPTTPAPVIAQPEAIEIQFTAHAIEVAGKLPAGNRVCHVLVYVDKDEFGVNRDYDAEAFVADYNRAARTFQVQIPWAELHPARGKLFQLRLLLVNDDGSQSIMTYNYHRDRLPPKDSYPTREVAL